MIQYTEPSTLNTCPPFDGLFPIQPHVKAAIKEDMEINGFDPSKPIDVWSEGNTIVDGHTRLQAAVEIGLAEVAIFVHKFTNEDDALEYAIRNQRDRRNLGDKDLLRIIAIVDERRKQGPKINLASSEAKLGRSARDTAAIVGASRSKVERARAVIDHADKETKQQVLGGDKSINAAYNETQEQRKHQPAKKPTFNRTNDNIEWATWTWNPVTGCKHGCPYCYARDIANRFYEQGFEPTHHAYRLAAPFNTTVPKKASENIGLRNVFVCSMADLFGEWVSQKWIDDILLVVRKAPQWNFLFLTKNPTRLIDITWPDNAWVGATVDVQARVALTEEAFAQIDAPVKFVSCEPLQERLTFTRLDLFDWLIIGARSKSSSMPEFQPPWEWVFDLTIEGKAAGCKVYWKPNLKSRPKEYPSGL